MREPFGIGEQVYIHSGRRSHLTAKVVGYPPLHAGFVWLRLFNHSGEITHEVDIIPLSHVRATVMHHAADDAPGV